MKKIDYFNRKKKDIIIDFIMFTIGGMLSAISIIMFTAPNNIAPGGVTGISTLLNYSFGFPIGIMSIIVNIPLFIWAVIEFNLSYIIKTAIATFISSALVDVFAQWIPAYTGDKLLAAIFGGILGGLGLGLIFMRGATTGGTDIAAAVMNKHFPHISIGKMILLADSVVIVASAIVYKNLESPMYAIINIFIVIKLIDVMIYGASNGTGKMIFIISEKNNEISDKIITEIGRGITALESRGCYTGIKGEVLLCAVRRQEVYKVYDIAHNIDTNAFIIVGDAGEIRGQGFKELKKDK